jgi:catechol 2,3-dioxygenase-like lactoylglutathione lyase family enzyme
MAVHDVAGATDFYCGKLGFAFVEAEATDLWRYFETRRMTFELFKANPDRLEVTAWGDGQAFRPLILVQNLSRTALMLEGQGVRFSYKETDSSAQIEVAGPEGVRLGIAEDSVVDTDWSHPIVAGIELKAVNLESQKTFYTTILGMLVDRETGSGVRLVQPNTDAWLHIVSGGKATRPLLEKDPEKPAFFHPIWISFETKDVRSINQQLVGQTTFLRPLTYHEDWKGTDILLADADGNVVQIVQYG